MGPGEGGDGERSDRKPRRLKDKKGRQGRAEPESQASLGQGVGKRVSNQGRGKPRSLRSTCRARQRDSGYGREMPARGGRKGLGGAGWPAVDIKGRPCWISGSGDGYVPISLSNCQKSNLVSGARAGLRLNGER